MFMRVRVADAAPLAILVAAVVGAGLTPNYTSAGPAGALAATVSTDRAVYVTGEGHSLRVRVSLTTPSGGPLTAPVVVGYATTPGTATRADFQPAHGTLVFPAGRSGITESFVVRIARDRQTEHAESVLVSLASGTIGVRIASAQPTIMIRSDRTPQSGARSIRT
jgi:beta-glucosidase